MSTVMEDDEVLLRSAGDTAPTALGEFPYPCDDPAGESRQLSWLRANASYMDRGLVGYLSAIGLLARGIVVNLLVTMPVLILLGLGVAAVSISGWGFGVAASLAAAVVMVVVFSPVVLRVRQVAVNRKTVRSGNVSTVENRTQLERYFGLLILLLGLAAGAEAASYFLDDFHFWIRERGLGIRNLASVGAVVLPALVMIGRALPSVRAGARRTALVWIAGFVGLLLPVLIVLFVADYLVFDVPAPSANRAVLIAGVVLWCLMALTLVVGLAMSNAFSTKFLFQAVVALVVVLLALVAGAFLVNRLLFSAADLDERLRKYDFGIAAGVVSEDAEDRRIEATKLADRVAGSPPAPLKDLAAFIDSSRRLDEPALEDAGVSVAEGVVVPELILTEAELLRDQNVGMATASVYASRLVDLAVTGSFDAGVDQDAYRDELAGLRDSVSRATALFQAGEDDVGALALAVMRDFGPTDLEDFYPYDGSRAQFATQSFVGGEAVDDATAAAAADAGESLDELAPAQTLFNEGDGATRMLINGQELPLVRRYPTLGAGPARDEFSALDENMRSLSGLIVNARVELARVATSSAQFPALRDVDSGLRWRTFGSSAIFAVLLALLIWAYSWLAIDPNRTSLHALYRDRLSSAFLVGQDPDAPERTRIEPDLNLVDLCRYELNSIAPYHLINCAVNLQASPELRTRGRSSDFFIFSKRFIGSEATGFCRSVTMDKVMPEMSVQTAMAISAAAAAPNMGRKTSRPLTAIMVFANARLGVWIPNPGRLDARHGTRREGGITVRGVMQEEQEDVKRRRRNLGRSVPPTRLLDLFGIAYSGGGIRSASLNLGITQALQEAGVFRHIDYMSTVSGGGYLGSAISVGMRSVLPVRSPMSGSLCIDTDDDGHQVTIGDTTYTYDNSVDLAPGLAKKSSVQVGERLVQAKRWTGDGEGGRDGDFKMVRGGEYGAQFYWRARPISVAKEMTGRLTEHGRSVNVSDGGHLENLATFELLRRRCRYIIVGDAEQDPEHAFEGLAFLIRSARVELGARIDIDLSDLRLDDKGETRRHFAVGRITYAGESEPGGTLLYLKSSITGSESVDVAGYRSGHPKFPHETTADQFFDEAQFESYRSLGYTIASEALECLGERPASFSAVQAWFDRLEKLPHREAGAASGRSPEIVIDPAGEDLVDVSDSAMSAATVPDSPGGDPVGAAD